MRSATATAGSSRADRRKTGPRPEAAATAAAPTVAAPPALRGRRNPKWIALGVVALCLGGLLSYVIYARVAHEAAVLAVAHTVHRGETVDAADLTTVNLSSTSGVSTVPADQLQQLVGRRAAFDLVEGSLLPVGGVADVLVPQAGRAVVGVRLVAGRAPTGVLVPGSPLRLVALPPSGADPAFTDQYLGRTIIARVVSQEPGADGSSVLVNVDVSATQAPTVALLAAQERLAVVRDADR
jgi:hypothetical protein